jgi:hypothetical protein
VILAEIQAAAADVAATSEGHVQCNAHIIAFLRHHRDAKWGAVMAERARENASRYETSLAGQRRRVIAMRDPEVGETEPDHGPTGLAATTRAKSMIQVATGDTRWGKEKTNAVCVQDATPWDHYDRGAQLTERQLHAGRHLTRLYQTGFSAMMALPAYGARSGAGLSDEEDAARSQARREYDRLANLIPHSCRHAMACMVRYEFPTMANRLAYVRESCDVIADFLQLPRN